MICTKVKYRTFNKAIKSLTRIKQKRDSEKSVYYCASCNAYHLTSKNKKHRLIK